MEVQLITTKDKRGEERLKRLLPNLQNNGLKCTIHYLDLTLDPMEAVYNKMLVINKLNKDKDFYVWVEDDALIDSKLTEKELITLIEKYKSSTSILSLGSHNYGEFKILTEEVVELKRLQSLQFLVVYKEGYTLIDSIKLEVEQDRYINTKEGHSVRTVVPYLALQDNLEGSRIKRYRRDELAILNRYEKQIVKGIKDKYCK